MNPLFLCCYVFLIAAMDFKPSSTSTIPPTTATSNCANFVQSSLDSNICYKLYLENLNYFEAETKCIGLSGHLSSINSIDENKIIQTIASAGINTVSRVWIGGSYFDNSTWESEDRTPVEYENYPPGQPMLKLGKCISQNVSNGFWSLRECNETMPFICKFFSPTTTTTSSSEELTTTFSYVCPEDTFQSPEDLNVCYKVSHFSKDYYTAKQICGNDNQLLTDIQNSNENNFIAQMISGNSQAMYGCWTGGFYIAKESKWVWADGSPIIGYDNWAPEQPSVDEKNDILCLVITFGKWSAASCKTELIFVCKINLTASSEATSTTEKSTPSFGGSGSTATTQKSTLTISSSVTTPTTKKLTTSIGRPNSTATTMKSTLTISSLKPTSTTTPKQSPDVSVKWYIIGGVLIIVITIATIFLIFLKIRKRKQAEINYIIQQDIKVKFDLSPLEKQLSHEDRLEMQIDLKNVNIDFKIVLGRGSNATVYGAFIKRETNQSQKSYKSMRNQGSKAALKLPSNFDTDEVETFVRELDALITVGSHPHIVSFYGWILYKEIPALLTEQAQMNLLTHVKSYRELDILPIRSILSILWQISQALEHVATFSMVHRDVACRNILLIDGNRAKLADFGLCCHCDESFTYRASLHKRFPLKWLSIEALVDRLFSEKSDVWSFGVLCYEVFTYGTVPYPAMSNVEMLEFLQQGKRLEKPALAPDGIYYLMLACWKADPGERPSFTTLSSALKCMMENETADYGYLNLDFGHNEAKKLEPEIC